MTTRTSFAPAPIALTRPDGTTQTFASLADAGAYLDQLVVANGGVSRPASTYAPHLSKASKTGRLAYGGLWSRPTLT